jgi:hypothetical protein
MSIKPEYHHLALEAGGAHYPTVIGDLGTQFGDALLKEVLQLCEDNPQWTTDNLALAIKQRYNLS